MDPKSEICNTSYNITGFGLVKQEYINTLLLISDILCIQKHFLLNSGSKKYNNTDKLIKKYGQTHDLFIVPAFKDSTQVTKGRGKGGGVPYLNGN